MTWEIFAKLQKMKQGMLGFEKLQKNEKQGMLTHADFQKNANGTHRFAKFLKTDAEDVNI